MIFSVYDYPKEQGFHPVRKIAHGIKENDPFALQIAAHLMGNILKKRFQNAVLIPIPSHSGVATTSKKLAQLIAEQSDHLVLDCLYGKSRQSQYHAKKNGSPLSHSEIKLNSTTKVSALNAPIIVVDNVIDTGETYLACCKALSDEPHLLTFARSERAFEKGFHFESLPSNQPLYLSDHLVKEKSNEMDLDF